MFSHPQKHFQQTACIRDKEITIASVRKERCHFQIFADVSSVQRFVPGDFVQIFEVQKMEVFFYTTEVGNDRAVILYIYLGKTCTIYNIRIWGFLRFQSQNGKFPQMVVNKN